MTYTPIQNSQLVDVNGNPLGTSANPLYVNNRKLTLATDQVAVGAQFAVIGGTWNGTANVPVTATGSGATWTWTSSWFACGSLRELALTYNISAWTAAGGSTTPTANAYVDRLSHYGDTSAVYTSSAITAGPPQYFNDSIGAGITNNPHSFGDNVRFRLVFSAASGNAPTSVTFSYELSGK